MSIFKKTGFPTAWFIIASFSALVTLPILFIYLSLSLASNVSNEPIRAASHSGNYQTSADPLITKVPSAKDLIRTPLIGKNDPSLGPDKAPVTIVEYSDYQCKFCQDQENILKQLMNEYKDKIRLIWKDYPESNNYSSSWRPNIASRCAGEQGKFWPYHDLLFSDNEKLDQQKAVDLAGGLQLDKNKFSDCLNSADIIKRIKANIEEANALDITGVPFIFINNLEAMGAISYEDLKKMVEMEINKN